MEIQEGLLHAIDRARRLSDTHYEGRVSENATEIFGLLHPDDQQLLLAYLLSVVVPSITSSKEKADTPDTPSVYNETADIEIHNQLELLNLKNWVAKAAFLMVAGALSVGLSALIVLRGLDGSLLPSVKDMFGLFTLITGWDK